MPQFLMHQLRHQHSREQARQQFDFVDQNQIVQRPRVRDDDRHAASEAKPGQRLDLTVKLLQREGLVHPMRLEKTVNLVGHRKAKRLPQFLLADLPGAKRFQHQRLQRLTLKVAPNPAKAGGKFVGNAHEQNHILVLPQVGR